MINPTPSPGSTPGSNAVGYNWPPSFTKSVQPEQDSLSLDQAGTLSSALSGEPEVRPDVVERGRALAADPNYPSMSIIGQVASQIVNSPDLSEDPS